MAEEGEEGQGSYVTMEQGRRVDRGVFLLAQTQTRAGVYDERGGAVAGEGPVQSKLGNYLGSWPGLQMDE